MIVYPEGDWSEAVSLRLQGEGCNHVTGDREICLCITPWLAIEVTHYFGKGAQEEHWSVTVFHIHLNDFYAPLCKWKYYGQGTGKSLADALYVIPLCTTEVSCMELQELIERRFQRSVL